MASPRSLVPVATRSSRRATRAPLRSSPRPPAGVAGDPAAPRPPRLRRTASAAAGGASRPAASRCGPEGVRAASAEVSGPGTPLLARGAAWTALPGSRARRDGPAALGRAAAGRLRGAAEGGGGSRGCRGAGEARAGGGRAGRRRRHLSTHPFPRGARALGPPAFPAGRAAEFCRGPSTLGRVSECVRGNGRFAAVVQQLCRANRRRRRPYLLPRPSGFLTTVLASS